MAQELVAEACAFGGALDQPGNVRHDEARGWRDAHDAQGWAERRERVVRHLWSCARDGADEGRLAGIRQPEQADVGQHPQLQRDATSLAALTARELPRRAVDARLEVEVS